MAEEQRRFSSAEDRRLHAENPFIVLGLTPPSVPVQIEDLQVKTAQQLRQLAQKYHPDFAPDRSDAAEKFSLIQSAYKHINSADINQLSTYAFSLVFGDASANWTKEMKNVAKPIIEAVIDAVSKANFLNGEVVGCHECAGHGFKLTTLDEQYLPMPVSCTGCGGEGAVSVSVADLRSAIDTYLGMHTIFEPHWRMDASVLEPHLSHMKEGQLSVPSPASLQEGIARYVTNKSNLSIKPFVTEMCSKLVALSNQAIEYHGSLSTLNYEFSKTDSVKRILNDCLLGIAYWEARKGRKHVQEVIEKQNWAHLAATGRTLRLKQEKEYSEARKRNSFPARNLYVCIESSVEQRNTANISQYAHNTLVMPKPVSYNDLVHWQQKLETSIKAIEHAESMGITPDVCSEWLKDGGFYAMNINDGPQIMGFHELAIFIAAFHALHQTEQLELFSLPDKSFTDFTTFFKFHEVTGFEIIQEKEKALCDAAEIRFPEYPSAASQCRAALKSMCMIINENIKKPLPHQFKHREGDPINDSLRAVFPHKESLNRYHRTKNVHEAFISSVREGGVDVTVKGPKMIESKGGMPHPKKILELSPKHLQDLVHGHTSVLDWHALILQLEARDIATIIQRLFKSGDILAQVLACNLFLLYLSTEDLCKNVDMSPHALFEDNSRVYRNLVKRGSQSIEVLDQLNAQDIRYLTYYTEIIEQSHGTLKELFTFLNEQTQYHETSDLRVWHPHWGRASGEREMVSTLMKKMASGNEIVELLDAMVKNKVITDTGSWCDLLLDAHFHDINYGARYVQNLVEVAPYKSLGIACGAVISALVQFDTHVNDIVDDLKKEINLPQYSEAFLDAPLSIFTNKEGNALLPMPEKWENLKQFINAIQSRQEDVASFFHSIHKRKTLLSLLQDVPQNMPTAFIVTVFNKRALTADDLPFVKRFTECPHPFLPCLIDNAKRSARPVQQKMLAECLAISDAVQVALNLIGEASKTKRDGMRAVQLIQLLNDNENTRHPYKFMVEPLQNNPGLKAELIAQLTHYGEILLQELA